MRAFIVALTVMVSGAAWAAPAFVCDMTKPSPAELCADRYAAAPSLLQDCIQEEADALNFINQSEGYAPDDVLADCGRAGCKAKYSKLKTTAACIKSMMSIKPRMR